ncbi:LLM class oxidoreductase [Sesbania bispinosa]|nr:LLM class oxidoreductase [Sesbania bispinosa]
MPANALAVDQVAVRRLKATSGLSQSIKRNWKPVKSGQALSQKLLGSTVLLNLRSGGLPCPCLILQLLVPKKVTRPSRSSPILVLPLYHERNA